MNEVTLTKMKQMKLYGMHGTFKTAIETGKTDDYTLDQFVSMIVDAEWDDRNTRRIERAIKNARFHYKASIENIIYDEARNIEKNIISVSGAHSSPGMVSIIVISCVSIRISHVSASMKAHLRIYSILPSQNFMADPMILVSTPILHSKSSSLE